MRRGLTLSLILTAILASTMIQFGCATRGPGAADTAWLRPKPDDSGYGWWYARFKINWPETSEPNLYLDTLLAHKDELEIDQVYSYYADNGAGTTIYFSKKSLSTRESR